MTSVYALPAKPAASGSSGRSATESSRMQIVTMLRRGCTGLFGERRYKSARPTMSSSTAATSKMNTGTLM